MRTLSFSEGWRYAHLGENDWQEVSLPHDAMLSEPRSEDSPGTTNVGWFAYRDYEYVKTFTAPADAAYLDFEGVYHRAEVYLDGSAMPVHPNGYFSFHVPVTEGEHTIRVIARNAEGPSSRWYTGAGIYRPVSLVCLPKDHILPESIVIRTLDYQSRRVSVTFQSTSGQPVTVEIAGHQKIGTKSVEMTLPGAPLWSPEKPNLLTCRLTCGEDVQEVRFGIRQITLDAKQGLRINGQRVLLLGACMHHDNGILGAAGHPSAERRKVALLKKAGYNAIRSAHNPCSRAVLNACDELGMLMMDEYVDMWYIHKTQYDYVSFFEQRWREDLRQMVEKDRNHPCVVMYSIGNEVSETAQPKGIELTGQMRDWLREMDDRPVTCGINIFFNFLSSVGFGVYSDDKAKKEAEKAEKQKNAGKQAKKKAVGSEFFNNLSGLMGAGFMKWGATLRGSDVKTREAFAKLDAAGYNYGVNRYRKDLKKYPDRVIVGSETFASDAYTFFETARNHPALIGDFVWTGIDYLGEVGLGAWEYRDYAPNFSHGPGWITSGSGVLDLTGKPQGQSAYTQVAYEQSKIRIGVVPADHALDRHSPSAWRFTNTFESWAWNGCEGKDTFVEVYARGHKVALYLNSEKIGEKILKNNCMARFKVGWMPGELTAIAIDEEGYEMARTSLNSARGKTKLRLLPEQDRISDGELLFVRLQYTDENGEVMPLARGNIHLQVTGGKLMAFGNGCSYNETGYLTDTSDTYYGEALAIIKPTSEQVIIKAMSPLGSAETAIG